MHVVFVEPAFPRNQREFVRGLHSVGAKVSGIGERPLEAFDPELRSWLHAYECIPSVTDEGALLEAVKRVQAREWVDRLEASVEAHILVTAKVREACQIPGTSVRTAFLCRDKPAMKDALREAGVPCAQSCGADSPKAAHAFAKDVGYPLILKPRDAAGAAGTYRVDNDEELEGAIQACGLDRGWSAAIEEFVEGHEGFFDTLCVDGEVVHEFISHYYPNVLEAMRTRWISPQIVVTNYTEAEGYAELKEMGRRVIEVLGIGTSATHMEWFYGPKGLKFSEIGCRPPGVSVWDLYSEGNDLDIYVEWAKAVLHGDTDVHASRRFATGMVALRPDRDGVVVACEGWEEFLSEYRSCVIDYHIPGTGTGTQGVEGGYMANAWVRLRHPDHEALREVMGVLGERVQLRAE